MKRDFIVAFSACVLGVLNLAPVVRAQDWQKLPGQIGLSETYKSGWLDLETPTTFAKGDKLRISIGGTASKAVVRLLPTGASPGDETGILGIYKVDKNRIVITLGEAHEKITQVSVHGGPNPWGHFDLGGGNAAATIQSVERASQ